MTVGSLFAGIGGIDLGFKQAGFPISWAIENDPACCRTYRYNFPDALLLEKDIRRVMPRGLHKVDLLVAGFPCQPFSVAGKERGFNDKRGNLFFEIMRFTDHINPTIIFRENVPNLMDHDMGTLLIPYTMLWWKKDILFATKCCVPLNMAVCRKFATGYT